MGRNVQDRGTDRMRALGKTSVVVWMTAAEKEELAVCAQRVFTPLSTWIRERMLGIARDQLRKKPRGQK